MFALPSSPSVLRVLAAGLAVGLLAACGGEEGRGGTESPPVRGPERPVADAFEPDEGPAPPDASTEDAAEPEDGADEVAEEDVTTEPPPLLVDEVILAEGGAGIVDGFASATPAEGGPAMVYPSDGTEMPRNVAAPVFQWEGPPGVAYRFRFEAEGIATDVYTTDWKWQPDDVQWGRIVRRYQQKEVTLRAFTLSGGEAKAGPPISFYVSGASVDGAVYFWEPARSAIVRLASEETTPEVVVSGTIFSCAGCHALSPDGTRLAYTRGGGTPIGNMGVVSTVGAGSVIQPERLSGYYPSFGPDNVHMAVSRGANIVVINTDTGADVATIGSLPGRQASQPAWSPARDEIVFAAGTAGIGFGDLAALSVTQAGLAFVRRAGAGWSDPQWLLEPGDARSPGETLFYPAFSPNGDWVVFNRADGAAGAGSSPPGSELWIVGGVPETSPEPLFLERAQGPPGTTNSWPKWAPQLGDGRLWIAFTSTRPYGRISAEHSQIWIASVRIADALRGVDPSGAAYWMPHQNLTSSNHVAYWAPFRKDEE